MRKLTFMFGIVLILLFAFSSTAVAAPPEKVNVIIGFDRPPGSSEQGLVRGFGGEIIYNYNIIPAIAASVPETAIQGLLRNPRVVIIEPDVPIHAIDVELENSWGVEHIGAGAVHSSGNKGSGVKVAILDSGIDYTHPELKDNYAGGYDFVNADNDPMDDNGHGTHVAGTIAALDNNDDSSVVGVAPDVEIYALKVLDANGSGSFINVIAALDWVCGEYGVGPVAKITNNSYGSSGYPGNLVRDAFDYSYALWGVLHVAAAGNSGNPGGGGDKVEYPGRFWSVVAVAATDQNDIRASFSSTGPDVELAAPGVSILSTYLNGSYATGSGTSMASPHVAGTAALVMAAHPDWTITQVRSELRNTANDLGTTGKDNLYGYGLVDADEAAIPTEPNNSPIAGTGGPYTGTEDVAIMFNGSNSYDPDGDSLTYRWDFGDGSIGTGVTPTHAYTAGGTYTVTLVVNDGKVDSEPSTTTADITEINDPPIANAGTDQTITDSDSNGVETVTLDASDSYDPDGDITAYEWSESGVVLSTEVSFEYSFAVGSYTVTLTVTDNDGAADTDTVTITVNESSASISVAGIEPNTVSAGTAVVVTITGSGFASGSDVSFENGAGPAPIVSNEVVIDSHTITATVATKHGGPPRNRVWDLRVTNHDGSSAVLTDGFTVTP